MRTDPPLTSDTVGATGMTFRNIRQMAYVCRPDEFEQVLQYWESAIGAGPFYVADFTLTEATFRGAPVHAPITVALTYFGDMQIEIIAPAHDDLTPWTEWMATTARTPSAGFAHHFLIDSDEFDVTVAQLLSAGCTEGLLARLSPSRRVAYVDGRSTFGSWVEVIEWDASAALAAQLLKDACRDWDGSEPRRSYRKLLAQGAT